LNVLVVLADTSYTTQFGTVILKTSGNVGDSGDVGETRQAGDVVRSLLNFRRNWRFLRYL